MSTPKDEAPAEAPLRKDTAAETLILDRRPGSTDAEPPVADDEVERLGPYLELGLLGEGGMGQVFRVADPDLERQVAIKVIRTRQMARPDQVARFLEEARNTARLQHPGIVAVHRLGQLPDGRYYFTMREVVGRTLESMVRDVHRASGPAGWGEARGGWSLRRLVDAFHKVCETMGYAHGTGVVHRDLKPANVMLGDHGEVVVLDWGIAKVLGRPDRVVEGVGRPGEVNFRHTNSGEIAGTPAWMSPEQARGEHRRVGTASDVWALGGILFMILYGVRPYHRRKGMAVLAAVAAGPPQPPEGPGPPVPPMLEAIRRKAMFMEPEDRYPDADALAADVLRWLDGAARREQAMDLVSRARALAPQVETLRRKATDLRSEMNARLSSIPAWAPEAEKIPAWTLGTEANQAEDEADRVDIEIEQLLLAAVAQDPDSIEGHSLLAERWRTQHAAAEAGHDTRQARRCEAMLRDQVAMLPPSSPTRVSHEIWLRGEGRLRLSTTEPGIPARLLRYIPRFGRLVAEPVADLGRTPIDITVPMGSYRVDFQLMDGTLVRYPVMVDRGVAVEDRAVGLPDPGQLGPDDTFVPAGWFWRGGDPAAVGGRPRHRAWLDAFVMKRFPVTNAQYLTFLHDLLDRGREAEALRHAPREKGGTLGEAGALIYGRDENGRFYLREDGDGDRWEPEWPVMMVDWHGACAYARWLSAEEGVPWRLPTDAEWGKAARGVDGRFHPWGDGFDPSWCNMVDSRRARPYPVAVTEFPIDESPYGVRGLAGNVRDWCLDADPVTGRRYNRGGFWIGGARECRAADRHIHEETHRTAELGFRLVRSWAAQS